MTTLLPEGTPLVLHGTVAHLQPGDRLLRGRDNGRGVHGFGDHIYAIRPDHWDSTCTPEGREGQEFSPWVIWNLLCEWAAMAADVWCESEHYPEDRRGYGSNVHLDAVMDGAEPGCLRVYAIVPDDPSTASENLTHETGAESVKYDCEATVLMRVVSIEHLYALCEQQGLWTPRRHAA